MRANNGAKAVRFGVFGSLSATNSPMAKIENIATAAVDPINAKGEPCRFNEPKCAAQATIAGASNERSPATIPIPIARRKMQFMNDSFSKQGRLRVFFRAITRIHVRVVTVLFCYSADFREAFIFNRVAEAKLLLPRN
jgi:hypothetical protein